MEPLIKTLLCITTGLGLVVVSGLVQGADIYRSEGPDGEVRFASQPLDKTYRLFLRDDTPRNTVRTANPPAGRVSAPGVYKTLALGPLIEQLARKHSVDPALVKAVIDVESRGNTAAVSPRGATGAMQLLPSTAAMYGVTELTDPAQNIEAGILHLKYLLARHDNNLSLALAAYNAGEGAVAKHAARIPPYRETMLYVPAVLARMHANQNQGQAQAAQKQ